MKAEIPAVFDGRPVATAEQMRRLDEKVCERYGLTTEELMENAGSAVAEETLRYLKEVFGKNPAESFLVVCCGRGANGGDGLICARKLREKGAKVSVFVCPPKKDGGQPGSYPPYLQTNISLAQSCGVDVTTPESGTELSGALLSCDVVVDALLGTGSSGKPAGLVREMIQAVTRSKKPVLAVDVPSGLDPDTGYHSGVFITAQETYTLGLAKRGLLAPHALKNVGRLKVLDIGYPPELLSALMPAKP